MNDHKLTHGSKRLSWLLRHGAREAGVAMDAAGWVAIDEVLAYTRLPRASLDEIVRRNDKSRLEVDGDRIRAAQGHSTDGTPVTCDALEASWQRHTDDAPLYHGTRIDAVASIARLGIVAGARTHVHLAASIDSKVGKRAMVQLLLTVAPERLRARGLEVYRSPNGVLLVRQVPADCIVDVVPACRNAERELPSLRALLGL